MIEIGLKYLGRKKDFVLAPSYLEQPVSVNCKSDAILWFEESIAERLMKDNPRMFQKMGERGEEAPVIAEIPEVFEPVDIFEEMTKREMGQYAHDEFGIDLDMRLSRANLLKQIQELAIEKSIEPDSTETIEEKEENAPTSANSS